MPDQLPSPRGTPTLDDPAYPDRSPLNPLLRVSGGLGLAGVLLGLSLLVLACAGFNAAFFFSPAVVLLGFTGGVLAILSARRSPLSADTSILAGLFLAALCLLGGVLELAVWQHWLIPS